ncbi:hypothetical protein GOP47_0022287 [Adiantum capillus-veneris]|uniref:Uncharacterized protein n=1 Tax=Adiantum capillus-veneris TaxID=13818 RepID=A0A9D4U9B8_ADICA|nr:hypothetical protein GOP47_0022287 [Adiantum capillus-veneris]
MAHCSSTLLHTPPSFATQQSAHVENPQDLLPPRKRLLVGLKQAAAAHPSSSSTPPPPAESLQIEVHVDTTHTSRAPPFSLLLHSPTQSCSSCGGGGVLLHRVPSLAGSSSYHCSSCVLAINKSMYCVLCYQVIEEGSYSSLSPSSGLLTCCRCQRLTHLNCALKLWSPSLEGAGLTLCRDCYTRNNGQFRESLVRNQIKIGSGWRFKEAIVSAGKVKLPLVDMQELVAARIVAIMAKKAAMGARQKAEILAKAAACAAMTAKAALDNVYKFSQRESAVSCNYDVADVSTAHKDDGTAAAPKTPKSLKRRALSAIVASEMLSKKDGAMANHMVTTEYPEGKRIRTSLDSESAEAKQSSCALAVEEPSRCATQRARLAAKRRKTLTALGLQKPMHTSKVGVQKRSSLASRKSKKASFLSKGKLGAIVSHVLASNRLSKSTLKSHSCKLRNLGPHCTILDDAVGKGVQKKRQSMGVMTLGTDHLLDESLPILRGAIASTDALRSSRRGEGI